MEEGYFKILVEKGYFDILDFLVELLNFKDDNDEIDFIEEFKRLNLDSNIFTINDTKSPENYIMVISSTLGNRNEISQNELIFLDRLSKIKGIEILLFLSEINQVNLSSNLSTTNNIFLKTNKFQLFDVKRLNLPLKIIINLNPNLNFREAIFNKSDASIYMKAIPISQKLKEQFPNSQIIDLTELNSQAIDEIATYIEKITNNSKQLDNSDNEYVKKLVR